MLKSFLKVKKDILSKLYLPQKKNKEAGFTLIELLAVIVILGIVATIAIPSVTAMVDKSKEEVCLFNLTQVGNMYKTHLMMEQIEHSNTGFSQFINEIGLDICSDECELNYTDGKIHCSEHSSDNESIESNDVDSDGVPFL